jgi:hypothetical protein
MSRFDTHDVAAITSRLGIIRGHVGCMRKGPGLPEDDLLFRFFLASR